ncbi:MAG TPA: hypothetical protein VKO18_08475 [Terriglobia bacterium]|nr:hypothetical protein [Terriglobia bacterium]
MHNIQLTDPDCNRPGGRTEKGFHSALGGAEGHGVGGSQQGGGIFVQGGIGIAVHGVERISRSPYRACAILNATEPPLC